MLKKIINRVKYTANFLNFLIPKNNYQNFKMCNNKDSALCLTLFGDNQYLSNYNLVSQVLEKQNIDCKFVDVTCEFQLGRPYSDIKRSKVYSQSWKDIYKILGEVCEDNFFFDLDTSSKEFETALKIFNTCTTKEEFLFLKYRDIQIGDLVYDTYLRFNHSKTIDLNDKFLLRVLYSTIKITDFGFLEIPKHKLVFAPYVGYIHWGLLPRIALKLNIPTFISCYNDQLFRRLRPEFVLQTKDFDQYDSKAQISQADLNLAKEALDSRLTGNKIDTAIEYMSINPFSSKEHFGFKAESEYSGVFFLHCFTDFPHIYRKMLYPDFYEWIKNSLVAARNSKFKFYVKPHPADTVSADIIENLKQEFPDITFLSPNMSNLEIVKSGIKVAFTVHGTVAHELPYLGIPVVCAGDNPHVNFDFCITAKSKEEYLYYINNLDLVPTPKSQLDVLKFYYFQNLKPFKGRLNPQEFQTYKQYRDNFSIKTIGPLTHELKIIADTKFNEVGN